jgi:hypothetical protein
MFGFLSKPQPEDQLRKEHATMLAALRKITKVCRSGNFNIDGVDIGKVAADAIAHQGAKDGAA